MPSLKDLRLRIDSVKSTQKITSAMKMVAAARLRRAQEQAEAARPYADRMERMLGTLAASRSQNAPPLLAGTGKRDAHLVVVLTSDRGLCGPFNSSIVREARRLISEEPDGQIRILCVGRKGWGQLRRDFEKRIVDVIEDVGRRSLGFEDAQAVAGRILGMFEAGEFDVCTVVYNRFRSAISHVPTRRMLVPCPAPDGGGASSGAVSEFEPDEAEILEALLPRNLETQIYRALLENNASEHGARMAAMDNATRNAGEMIDALTLNYNRTRQAHITRELIEIISGAEAL